MWLNRKRNRLDQTVQFLRFTLVVILTCLIVFGAAAAIMRPVTRAVERSVILHDGDEKSSAPASTSKNAERMYLRTRVRDAEPKRRYLVLSLLALIAFFSIL
jgi:hypothetical protein